MPESPKTDNSFKSLLKSNTIFGGVQVFQVLISLIRGKFAAILLGPIGMGINAIYSSAFQALATMSCMGLNMAIVKEVSNNRDNPEALEEIMAIARRVVMFVGFIGAMICLVFANSISRLSFGNEEYAWGFRVLSIALVLTVAGGGLQSILQGFHEVKALSRSSIAGGIAGLIFSIPLYYFYGADSIPVVIVAMSGSTYVIYLITTRKIFGNKGVKLSYRKHYGIIKRLLLMGLILVSGEIFATIVTYATNLVIRLAGNMSEVGLFQGANSLTNQYAGMVFMAIMMDYFPRLAAAKENNKEIRNIVCRQMEIVGLIATPMLCLLILFVPLAIKLLLSPEFERVIPLARLLSLGILIKALSYPLGFITFAKDNRKVFFWVEVIGANLLTFGMNCGGYLLFGLNGLGLGLILDCVVCLIVYCRLNYQLYGLLLNKDAQLAILQSIIACGLVLGASFLEKENGILSYTLMGIVTLCSIIYSLRMIRKKLSAE